MNLSVSKTCMLAKAGKALQVLGAGVALLLFCLPAFSQLNLGRIYGGITDQTGGFIAGATVTVTDVARGISRPLTTDRDGEFNAPSLLPGTYTIRAEAKGFQTVQRENVEVGVGQELRVDLTLQPGAQTQTITVTESIPLINTSNATLGGTVENQAINDLPLNGRLFTKLLDYQPGITSQPGKNSFWYQSNGNRQSDNVWMFDGIDDVDNWSMTGPLAGTQNTTILPVDAIQEVNVVQNPKAEFGWKPGAVVNVGLKSGTNSIHGTAYAYGRDTAMDAKNAFLLPTQPKALDQLEQFGATIGGPIKKDKLFYFAGFEGQLDTIGDPQTVTVPTTATVGGGTAGNTNSFLDAINTLETNNGYCNPAAAGCTKPLSQLSLNLAGCTLPAGLTGAPTCNATNGVFGNSLANITEPVDFNNLGTSYNGIGKIDYHLNDHNSFNGEYFIGKSTAISPGFLANAAAVQPYWAGSTPSTADVVRGVWVWTPNSNWLNEARFGYNSQNYPSLSGECTSSPLGQVNYLTAFGLDTNTETAIANWPGLSSGCRAFPSLTISGFSALGANAGYPLIQRDWAGLDNVSYTRGKHQFKFGFETHFLNVTAGRETNANGTLSFGTPAAFSGATPLDTFLVGVPSSGTLLLGDPVRHADLKRYALFAQDDWRLTQRVTVNLGLRYEYVAPLTEQNNLLGNFDPNTPSGLIQASNGHPAYQAERDGFGPRLGLVWDVTGKGTTVVRTGASVVDASLLGLDVMLGTGSAINTIPTGFTLEAPNGTTVPSPGNIAVGNSTLASSQLSWATNTPIFNTSASALACGNGLGLVNPGSATTGTTGANPQNAAPCAISPVDQHLRNGYVTTWTLGVQHAFTDNLSLNVGYVGAHGTHLGGLLDINQAAPGAPNTGSAPGSGNEQMRRPYTENCAPAVITGGVLVSGVPGGKGLNPSQCFPYFSTILLYTDAEESNYDALQANLTERVTRGLSFNAGYTWAHSLDDSSRNEAAGLMSSSNVAGDYGDSTFDVRNHFTLAGSYTLPARKSPGQVLEGWQVNSAITLLGGLPYNAQDTTSDISGSGDKLDRWSILGSPSNIQAGGPGQVPCFGAPSSTFAAAKNCVTVATAANMPATCITAATNEPSGVNTGLAELASLGCYFQNGTAIVPPAQGTFGDMGRDVLRGKPFREWDFSVTKDWKFKERLTAQFRGELFNILNRTQYSLPSANPSAPSTFGQSTGTPNIVGTGASYLNGSGGPREIQLGLKFIF